VTALDRAVTETRRLEVEHERLQAERRAQATPLRVEKLAKEQLQMRAATPAITQYVTLQPAGAAVSPAQPVQQAAGTGSGAEPAVATRPAAAPTIGVRP
jgi:cell division protein FtsL